MSYPVQQADNQAFGALYYSHPHIVPSAPPPEVPQEGEPNGNYVPLYPSLNPDSYPPGPVPLYPPQVVTYPIVNPHVKTPADAAYDRFCDKLSENPEMNACFLLPPLSLDNKSIQTLKQIEKNATKGIVVTLLTVIIKVLQVVGKLAWRFACITSLVIFASILCRLSVAPLLWSKIVMTHLLGKLIIGGGICQLSAFTLRYVKHVWMNSFFYLAMRDKKHQIEPLKQWIKVKNLSEIEFHSKNTIRQLEATQQTSYSDVRMDNISYLQDLIGKMNAFRKVEKNLNWDQSMPLFTRLLIK